MTPPFDPASALAVAAARSVLRVAVLGAGTVGSAVVRGFLERAERLAVARGPRLELAGVATVDPDRARELGVPDALITDGAAHLAAAHDVDIVVELIGGQEPARTFVRAALEAGKPVVTANKALLAMHGPELEALARRTGAPLRFEAAVGGGIPVLGPLAGDLAANRMSAVRGVVNGTTNFVLTAMAEEGREYDDALRDAQAAGYAEADATADVEGDDAASKIVILARLAFGGWLAPQAVVRAVPRLRGAGRLGITGVTRQDVAGAAEHGLVLRLVASAHPGPDGSIAASVVPTAVPANSPLGRTRGVLNRIEVDGSPIGSVAFVGPGAGGDATSSAVLGDLVSIARGAGSTWAGLSEAEAVRSDPDAAAAAWLAAERRWLAVVTGGPAIVSREAVDAHAFRRELTSLLPEDADATLYPVEGLA